MTTSAVLYSFAVLLMISSASLSETSESRPIYEEELQTLIAKVTPLFEIIRFETAADNYTEHGDSLHPDAKSRKPRNNLERMGYGGGYGGYGDYGQSSYGNACCAPASSSSSKTEDLLPLLALAALSLLLLYLIVLATTTTMAGRRRRQVSGNNSLEAENDIFFDDSHSVLLDGPTWLSLIHELWEQDGAVENTSCAQHTLCKMNTMAMSAAGQAGWAVSLSSLPLSYLLHRRHDGGFTSYLDAALIGRAGGNCTELFSNCPRLQPALL